jgi:hypothetical protein
MAERAREEAQRERADARGRRRSLLTQPFEALNEAANGDGNGADALVAAKKAARTTAAAAFAGGVAGAAKALIQRRAHADGDEEDDADRLDEERSEEPGHETQPRMSGDDSDGEDDAPEEEGGDSEPEQESGEQPVAEQEETSGGRQNGTRQKGAPSSDVADVAERARKEASDLLGKEVESVSGISRQNGSWAVTVEVVEVHRVPDSTDVLSSYEVVLDDDRNLVSVERRGRYRRSQVEEER